MDVLAHVALCFNSQALYRGQNTKCCTVQQWRTGAFSYVKMPNFSLSPVALASQLRQVRNHTLPLALGRCHKLLQFPGALKWVVVLYQRSGQSWRKSTCTVTKQGVCMAYRRPLPHALPPHSEPSGPTLDSQHFWKILDFPSAGFRSIQGTCNKAAQAIHRSSPDLRLLESQGKLEKAATKRMKWNKKAKQSKTNKSRQSRMGEKKGRKIWS